MILFVKLILTINVTGKLGNSNLSISTIILKVKSSSALAINANKLVF